MFSAPSCMLHDVFPYHDLWMPVDLWGLPLTGLSKSHANSGIYLPDSGASNWSSQVWIFRWRQLVGQSWRLEWGSWGKDSQNKNTSSNKQCSTASLHDRCFPTMHSLEQVFYLGRMTRQPCQPSLLTKLTNLEPGPWRDKRWLTGLHLMSRAHAA